jgi:hypothetical protein
MLCSAPQRQPPSSIFYLHIDMEQSMATQIRIFSIRAGHIDNFLQAWLAGVYPLRLAHGFSTDGAWVIPERNQFIWILRYDGSEDWENKDRAYYASADRTSLEPDPAQYIERVEQHFIKSVLPPALGP